MAFMMGGSGTVMGAFNKNMSTIKEELKTQKIKKRIRYRSK